MYAYTHTYKIYTHIFLHVNNVWSYIYWYILHIPVNMASKQSGIFTPADDKNYPHRSRIKAKIQPKLHPRPTKSIQNQSKSFKNQQKSIQNASESMTNPSTIHPKSFLEHPYPTKNHPSPSKSILNINIDTCLTTHMLLYLLCLQSAPPPMGRGSAAPGR